MDTKSNAAELTIKELKGRILNTLNIPSDHVRLIEGYGLHIMPKFQEDDWIISVRLANPASINLRPFKENDHPNVEYRVYYKHKVIDSNTTYTSDDDFLFNISHFSK